MTVCENLTVFFFLRAVVNIPIQTLIIPPRLLFRKMIISQLEHGPSVRERVEKNKHSSRRLVSVFASNPTLLTFTDSFARGESNVLISGSIPLSSITRLAFLQLVKWQTVENFSYLAISFKVGSSPWNVARSISRECRDGFGSQRLTAVISLFVRSSWDVLNFKSLRFCT